MEEAGEEAHLTTKARSMSRDEWKRTTCRSALWKQGTACLLLGDPSLGVDKAQNINSLVALLDLGDYGYSFCLASSVTLCSYH